MSFTRRHFLASSAAALSAGMTPRRMTAQAPAAAPPLVTRFEDLRRGVGIFVARGGTIGYLVNDAGALAIDSQYANTAPLAMAGLKQRTPKGVELRAEHAPPRRPHRRQPGVPGHGAADRRPRELPRVAPQDLGRGQDRRPDVVCRHHLHRQWQHGLRRRDRAAPATTAPATPAAMRCFTSRRPTSCTWATCCSTARIPTSIGRPARAWPTGSRCSTRSRGRTPTTRSSSPATARTTTCRCTKADLTHFRDYLSASLDTAHEGHRGRAVEGRPGQKTTALPGFEDTIALNAGSRRLRARRLLTTN